MDHVRLGRSELEVSRIAFGTWELSGDWGPTDAEAMVGAIRHAADRGVTFFDTAQAYGFGTSERLLGEALKCRSRGELVIATKGGLRRIGPDVVRDGSPDQILSGVDESLRALGMDYIDLYQVHWPDPATPFEETAAAIARVVKEGKVRHVGVSNFDTAQIAVFNAILPVETVQPPYSLFRRDIERELLPYCVAHDIGVLVYGPLAHGLMGGDLGPTTRFADSDWRSTSAIFSGQNFERNLAVAAELGDLARREHVTLAQLAIAWTLSNSAVQAAIVGMSNLHHVDEAIAATDIEFDTTTMSQIGEIVRGAVEVVLPGPGGGTA
jgi:aryl-alcohol dehydrogenase-like predicted oxidoreductase